MNVRMVSYADNFEDVLLQRAFPGDGVGFYIDIGAYDPVEHSITKHFYDRGWRGINVEPNPAPFAKLKAQRTRDVNLNLGLSDREGSLTIYEAPSACWSVDRDLLTGWFGADARDVKARSIPVTTLANICERHVPAGCSIDFLKIDVEGHEHEVIAGGDWTRWRPRIVVAEGTKPMPWESILFAAGYQFTLFDGINRVYVRDEDEHLVPILSTPVNVTDGFGIYGYLAVIADLQRRLGAAQDLGHNAIALTRRLKRMSTRYPRAARLASSVLSRMASR